MAQVSTDGSSSLGALTGLFADNLQNISISPTSNALRVAEWAFTAHVPLAVGVITLEYRRGHDRTANLRRALPLHELGLIVNAPLQDPGKQTRVRVTLVNAFNIAYLGDGRAEITMSQTTTMTVRISGALSEFVASNVGENGSYENISEYVRDLIRRDKERAEMEAFDRLKAELTRAFAAPEESYSSLTAAEVIARNRA
jgi:antitoxin ParD1/3/4